jgi:excisionase family DNA binding protein
VGVREAAQTLGVHENTLRRWERKGLLRAVKLPTGVRRFRREDVERVRNAMWDHIVDEPKPEPKPEARSRSRSRT